MNELVIKEYLGNKIEFKMVDGMVYANANQMAIGFGGSSKLADWKRSPKTKEYINTLNDAGIVDMEKSHIASKGGENKGSTWIHEKLVLNFARYLNINFELWCDEQIATLIREGRVELQKPIKKLEDKLPMELFTDNVRALNDAFDILGLNIPKELVASTAITTTQRITGYDFNEVKLILNKQEEEAYHTKSEVCKRLGIKGNKVNLALRELGLQIKGSTSMQPWILTELGKKYGVERSYTNNGHQGYEIKFKESSIDYIKERLNELPSDWLK